jgi:hypothetical protein
MAKVITPPIAGLMIDLLDPLSHSLQLSHLGYKSVFLLASFLLLAAVVLVRQIRVGAVRNAPLPQLICFPLLTSPHSCFRL